MKWCAIIPARKGSKGIPGKNKVLVKNRELIRYTFEAALGSRKLEQIILSTDDQDLISLVKRDYPLIRVPFLRPAELASDSSKSVDVVLHALGYIEPVPEYIVLLQPTAPLRTSLDIDDAISRLEEHINEYDSLVSLCKVEEPHPYKMKRIVDGKVISLIEGTSSERPRQELPEVFRLNGAIYIASTNLIRERATLMGTTIPYVMPPERSLNIDTTADIRALEMILSAKF